MPLEPVPIPVEYATSLPRCCLCQGIRTVLDGRWRCYNCYTKQPDNPVPNVKKLEATKPRSPSFEPGPIPEEKEKCHDYAVCKVSGCSRPVRFVTEMHRSRLCDLHALPFRTYL
jgi:hypothetical protein